MHEFMVETASRTHRGRVRETNEDRHLVKRLGPQGLVLAVADGLGGAPGGSEASEIMRAMLSDWPASGPHPAQELYDLVLKASHTIWQKIEQDAALEGMGTTVTATLLADGVAHWVHVGDSRFYVFRQGRLTQVTTDQTMAQLLVEESRITPDEARSHPYSQLLDQSVGDPLCEPVTGSIRIKRGDLLLHTTDGLHDALSEQELIQLLAARGTSLEDKAESLLRAALEAGGKDNITLILAQL